MTFPHFPRVAMITTLLALTFTEQASAQVRRYGTAKPSGKVRDALEGEAQAAFERATTLFDDGDYRGARAEFERAFELSRESRVLYNVAVCDKAMRKYARAIDELKRSLRESGPRITPAYERTAKDTIAALEPFVSEVSIAVDQEGALVLVDGDPIGTSPLDGALHLEVGEHVVSARKSGFLDLPKQIRVISGEVAKVTFVLEIAEKTVIPEPAAEAPTGIVRVQTDPSALVELDGQVVGTGSCDARVRVGEHRLVVRKAGSEPRIVSFTMADRETRTYSLLPLAKSEGISPWVWVAGGVGVAGGAAALAIVLNRSTEYRGSGPGVLPPRVVPAWSGGFP